MGSLLWASPMVLAGLRKKKPDKRLFKFVIYRKVYFDLTLKSIEKLGIHKQNEDHLYTRPLKRQKSLSAND